MNGEGKALGGRTSHHVETLQGDMSGKYEALVAGGIRYELAYSPLRVVAEMLGTAEFEDRRAVKQLLDR